MAEEEKKEKAAEESQTGEGDSQAEKATESRKKLFLILGIGLIGVLAAGIGGFFIMQTLGASETELSAEELKIADIETSEELEVLKEAEKGETPQEQQQASGEGQPETVGEGAEEGQDGGSEVSTKSIYSEEEKFGDTIAIPKMELNLGNPLENRFLRFGVSLEFHGGESQGEEIQRRLPQIRDIIITTISRKTRIELLSPEGKENLRKQLKNTFNEIFAQPVSNVYFTEFLVE